MFGVGKHTGPAGWLRMGPCLPTRLHLRFLNMWLITHVKNQLALNSFIFHSSKRQSYGGFCICILAECVCVWGDMFPGNLNFNITHDRHLLDKY